MISHICFTFHMPLFFILSGYFMHPEREFRWKKESKELIATYGLTALTIVAINSIGAFIMRTGTQQVFKGWAAAAYYGAGDLGNYLWPVPFRIGALWFLLALFWAHLFVHIAYKSKHPSIIIVGLFIVGYVSAQVYWLPLSIQSGMTAAAFVYCGVLAKQHGFIEYARAHWWVVVIAAAIWVAAIVGFDGFSMAMNQYGRGPHFVLSVLGALTGTVSVLTVSMLLDRHVNSAADILSRFGKNSLAILCIHIIEDDVTPWQVLLPSLAHMMPSSAIWFVVFAVRLAVDVFFAWVLFCIPRINELFFPYLAKAKG